MKLSAKFGLIFLVVAASLAGTGCKQTAKPVTPIPRSASGPTGSPVTPGPISPPGGLPFNPGGGGTSQPLPPDDPNGDGNKPGENPLPPENLRYGRPEDRATFAGETVFFEYDRANVQASETDKVKKVAEFLKGNPLHDLAVEGHCDERGTEEYNRALGERRALAVREALVSLGISGSRITTTSFGEDQPADPGHDDAAWSKNRRGEFIILLPQNQ
jgi:peptidoglycan-associated lipoprotein